MNGTQLDRIAPQCNFIHFANKRFDLLNPSTSRLKQFELLTNELELLFKISSYSTDFEIFGTSDFSELFLMLFLTVYFFLN